jgi:hypothetical protein
MFAQEVLLCVVVAARHPHCFSCQIGCPVEILGIDARFLSCHFFITILDKRLIASAFHSSS